MAEKVDVLICGSGSAGLCAAVWLAKCGVNYKILEQRAGPLKNGQADGVQCRTVELFESFGISEDLLKEAYHVLEVAFWAAGEGGDHIKRTHSVADTEPGLSHQPHVILNQARINGMMIQEIQRVLGGSAQIDYGVKVEGVELDQSSSKDPDSYCVTTKATYRDKERVYQSKYVLACDGAHSAVRRSLGFQMVGDTNDAVWGVMDLHARTDFPDIRKKAVLHAQAGNIIIIPREGNSLVRFYIELGNVAVKDVTLEDLQERARRIFQPFSIEFMETVWWSAYSIGQRLADNFTLDGRIFLTGDACHTHSPKAGQGMNVSLQDGYNIGWKLAAVLSKRVVPSVLETYISERQKTASDLIEFDRFFSKLFSTSYRKEHSITAEDFKNQFVQAGRYTAGQGVKYGDSALVSTDSHAESLASGIDVGMRLPSAQLVRFCDARPMQLAAALASDSRWYILVFAGDVRDPTNNSKLKKLASELDTIVQSFTPPAEDPNSIIQGVLVIASPRKQVEQSDIPTFFTPATGKWKIKHLHSVFADDESYNAGHGHAYERYGIDPSQGCLVIVRPDQYVAKVCSLGSSNDVMDFFKGFMISTDVS